MSEWQRSRDENTHCPRGWSEDRSAWIGSGAFCTVSVWLWLVSVSELEERELEAT